MKPLLEGAFATPGLAGRGRAGEATWALRSVAASRSIAVKDKRMSVCIVLCARNLGLYVTSLKKTAAQRAYVVPVVALPTTSPGVTFVILTEAA